MIELGPRVSEGICHKVRRECVCIAIPCSCMAFLKRHGTYNCWVARHSRNPCPPRAQEGTVNPFSVSISPWRRPPSSTFTREFRSFFAPPPPPRKNPHRPDRKLASRIPAMHHHADDEELNRAPTAKQEGRKAAKTQMAVPSVLRPFLSPFLPLSVGTTISRQ